MTHTQTTGRYGEQVAANFLEDQGYRIVDRNVRTPYGEIDLVVVKDQECKPGSDANEATVVFVEVKTRTTSTFGPPEESITSRKQSHLLASIHYYMQQNPNSNADWRCDVIAVEKNRQSGEIKIVHFENAVTE